MDYLLEIGTEEIPARLLSNLIKDFQNKLSVELSTERIVFKQIDYFATYRRLTLIVRDIARLQQDLKVECKGPPEKIAYDPEGQLTLAGKGFLKKMNTESSYRKDGYLYISLFQQGRLTSDLLAEIVLKAIRKVYLPVAMKWGSAEDVFIRPVHWILSILGDNLLSIEFAGQKSSNLTYGHRLLSKGSSLEGKEIVINDCEDYFVLLEENFVIVDMLARKDRIRQQLLGFDSSIDIPENLLDEVNCLVEFPTVLQGSFAEEFLKIPEKVLITTMQKNQKYFPLYEEGKLINKFLIVADNVTEKSTKNIISGNERVVRARLCDAKYFWQEDSKRDFSFFMKKMQSIVFQQKLGTMEDKINRNIKLAKFIGSKQEISEKEMLLIQKVVEYMKADLATSMVFEFPELQGYIGKQLALSWGLDKNIAQGISEHYLPMYNGDKLPSNLANAVASVVDKMDVICAHFVLKNIPTGSNDPYALRRQANGVINILMANEILYMDIRCLIVQALLNLECADKEVQNMVEAFFLQRIENILKDRGIESSIVKCVLTTDITLLNKRLDLFAEMSNMECFSGIVEAIVRVNNLAIKAAPDLLLSVDLFELPVEHLMWKCASKIKTAFEETWGKELIAQIVDISKIIEDYFTQVMVMVEDEKIRNNRLSLLIMIDNSFKKLGNFKQIVI